ncbi:MAG: hypothetical protein PHY44_01695 [Lachnospiraceae bacterium]|nr:hypothetical protein [Lachnospiraceae bacterium]
MKIYLEVDYDGVQAIYTDDKNVSLEVIECNNDVFNEIISRNIGDFEDEFEYEAEAKKEYENLEFEEREIVDNVIGLSMQKRNLKMIYPKISKQQFAQ